MAEGARLESVYTLTRIEGSNPSLSANTQNNRFSETGFFMPGALSFRAFQPVQAYLAILIQPRHWSALPPPPLGPIFSVTRLRKHTPQVPLLRLHLQGHRKSIVRDVARIMFDFEELPRKTGTNTPSTSGAALFVAPEPHSGELGAVVISKFTLYSI